MELLKLEDFPEGLQKSWREAKKSIEMAKKAMKKKFNKTKSTRIEDDNMWLKAKNIQLN